MHRVRHGGSAGGWAAERAFSALNVLLESGEQRIGVLALITRQYRQMMYVKDMQESRMPQPQVAKALGVPPFALGQLIRRAGAQKRRTAETADGALRQHGF